MQVTRYDDLPLCPLASISPVRIDDSAFIATSFPGFVETMRGKEGGYWLSRPPTEITYGDIVRATRGSLALVPCAARLAYAPCENCVDEAGCRLRAVMLSVRDETANILDRLTLAETVKI